MTVVIGVAGGTGSGKGAVAKRIAGLIGQDNCAIIGHDDYYNPETGLSTEELASYNYDHPKALQSDLLVAHLKKFKLGEPVHVPKYNFNKHCRKPFQEWGDPIEPKAFIIVEGILVLQDERIRAMCNYKLFVDTPDDERLARRILRDTKERGRTFESVIEQWRTTVQPMYLAFCEPTKRYADKIVPEGGENVHALEVLDTWTASLLPPK